jgi:hypothetical protein
MRRMCVHRWVDVVLDEDAPFFWRYVCLRCGSRHISELTAEIPENRLLFPPGNEHHASKEMSTHDKGSSL